MSKLIYSKLDANFFSNQKVIRAGRDGRDVYLHALCQNAQRGAQGWIPIADVEPWYVARQTDLSEDEARNGLQLACNAGLVTCDDERVTICGWDDEWSRQPLTNAERQAKFRTRRKGVTESTSHVTDNVTSNGSERSERSERESALPRVTSLSGFSDSEPSRGEKRQRASKAPDVATWTPPSKLSDLARDLGVSLETELTNFRLRAREKQHAYATEDALEAAFEKFMRGSRDKGSKKPSVGRGKRRSFFVDPLTDEQYEVDENGERIGTKP